MDKKKLEEIANLSDLKKYQESDEYKRILEDCDRRNEEAREKVREMYNYNITKEQIFDFHDKTYRWIEFLRDRLEEINSTSKWAKALKQEIIDDIQFNDKMVTGKCMDKYNNVYSQVLLNNYDMVRLESTHNRLFEQILQWLINTLEIKPKEKDETIY